MCNTLTLKWLAASLGVGLFLQGGGHAQTGSAGTYQPTAAGTYYWPALNFGDGNYPVIPVWTGTTPAMTYPTGIDAVANVNNNISGAQTIVLDQPITLGTLNLGDADGSHTFTILPGYGGSFIFDGAGSSAFLNKAAGSTSVDTIAAGITLTDALLLQIDGGTLSLTGVVSGPSGLTKAGAGGLAVSGQSTYAGGTTATGGTLSIGASSVGGLLGSVITTGPLGTGSLTLNGPVVLTTDGTGAYTLANATTVMSDFALGSAGSGSLQVAGAVNLNGGTRVVTVTGNQYMTGLISNGGLSTAGTGTLYLRGGNSYADGSTIGAGTTVVVGGDGALGSGAVSIGDATLAADRNRTLTNSFNLTGNLTLGGDPRIAGQYDGQLTLSGAMNLGGANRTFTVNTSGVPTTIANTADTISGVISNGAITKEGNGRLVISGANTTITGITINAGVLQFNSAGAFGTNPANVAAGAGFITLNGGTLALSATSQTSIPSNMGVNVASASTVDVMSSSGDFVLFNNTAATLTGSGDLTKVGAGALILVGSGTSTWNGNLNIVQGTFTVGTTGSASNGAPLANVASVTVQSTARFRIANGDHATTGNNANRVNNDAGITMNGGWVEFFASTAASANNYSETLGTVTLNRGANGFTSSQAGTAGNTSSLVINNLVRTVGATANFASPTAYAAGTAGLGQTTRNTIILNQINGSAPVAGFIGGWATVNTAAAASDYNGSTAASEWAKYHATLGVQAFAASDYNGGGSYSEAGMTAATYHAKISTAAATTSTLGGARTAGSLHLNGTAAAGNITVNQNNHAFTISSGGILVTGTTTTTAHAITGGTLSVGGGELIVNTAGSNGLNISSRLTGNIAVTKSGNGVLTLSGVNDFTGNVNLNSGTLRLTSSANGYSLALPSTNTINVVAGTIANTSTAALVIGNNITIVNSLTLGDSVGAGRTILTGNVTLNAPSGGIASIIAHTNTTAQIMGDISGGSLRIAQVGGTGRVALLGNNSFTANDRIQVDSGMLTVGSAGALGSAKIVLNGGGLETGFGFRSPITNDILFTANQTAQTVGLGGSAHGNPLTLAGTVDLGGTMRTIYNGDASVYTTITGVITNGGIVKGGNGVMIFTNANNNYTGGTEIADAHIWLKGDGVAGANVLGNNITITTGVTGDGGIKLDGPNNLGSNQILTFNLPASMTTGTQVLSLGRGFSGNSNANPVIGFQPVTGGTGTGIMNMRLSNVANGQFMISLDGLTLNQDVIGGPGGTNAAAANVKVWIGASQAGGVIAGPLSAGFGGNYRLGGGLDTTSSSTNQAGVLQVNADVLSGSGILFIGSETNTGMANVGNSSVVWMRGDQSGFSGRVSIGAGGILNVAQGSYLGSGTDITLRGGTLRILNESGLSGYDASHINNSFASKNITVGVGGGTVRYDMGTGAFSNSIMQFGTLTIDATASNTTFTVSDAGVNSGGMNFTSLTTLGTNTSVFNVGSNHARVTGNVSISAGFQKAGAGNLILDTPSTTSLVGNLDMNAGTLTLTNPDNFTAPATIVSGAATIAARSNAAAYSLNLGNITMSGGNLTLVFGNLDFTGSTNSNVTMNSNILTSGANRTLVIRAFDDTKVTNAGTISTATNAITLQVDAGHFVNDGALSGTNALNKTGRGFLELTGNNTGFSGNLQVGLGAVLLSHNNAAGSNTINFNTGSGLLLANSGITINNNINFNAGATNNLTIGGLSGNSTYAGNINLANATGLSVTPTLANFDVNGVTTFSGVISNGNAFTGQGILTKVGNGTVRLTNANTFSSGLAVQRGELVGGARTSGSPFGNNSAITIGGGALRLEGIGVATVTSTTNALIVGGNNYGGKLILDATAGGSTSLTVGSLGNRVGRGTLVIIPTTGGFGATENLNINAAPSAANYANGIYAGYIVKQTSATNGTGNFVTRSGAAVVDKSYTAGVDQGSVDLLNGATAVIDNNVVTTLTDDREVFGLRTNSNIDLGGYNLNLGDKDVTTSTVSGLILNNNANILATGGGEIRMGSSETNIFVGTGFTSTISARIVSMAATNASTNYSVSGLTKSGDGTLILSGNNGYTGLTTIAGGTLQAGAANVIGKYTVNQKTQNSGVQIAAGAQFDMSTTGYDQTIGSLAGQGRINIGSNTLIVGNDNTSTVFSGQIVASTGATLWKTGNAVLELSNLQTGSDANSAISNIFVDQGTLRIHVSDGAPHGVANGDSYSIQSQSAIALGSTFQLRGGTLDMRYNFGDTAGNAHTLRTNYNFNVVIGSTIVTDSGLIGTNTNKVFSVNNITLNRFTLTTSSGNTNALQVDGLITMTDNANLNVGSDIAIATGANITDNGNFFTLNKQGGANLTINANTTFAGGTVISLGRVLFGQRGQWSNSYEDTPSGGTHTYNSTAKLGTGQIWVNSFNNANAVSAIRLTQTNLHADQLVYVRSSNLGGHQTQVELLNDGTLDSYHLRSTTGGSLTLMVGPSAGSTNLGRWTTTLNQQQIGNGTWGFAGATDVVYDNNSLGAGVGETYRFYGTTGGAFILNRANTLTGDNALKVGQTNTSLGAPNGMGSNAIVTILADQDYTGLTTIHRGGAQNSNLRSAPQNILRVYADLKTSGIENYGRLEMIGAGRFTDDAGMQVTQLNMRYGSYLYLDYDSAFTAQTSQAGNYLVDVSATTGINATNTTNKWQDDLAMYLPGSTLNLTNYTTRDTHEVIGGLLVSGLADVILSPRSNGAVVLELNGALVFKNITDTLRITGTNLGTAQPTGASGTAQTRVVFTDNTNAPSILGTLTNGTTMISPRFFAASTNTFMNYTPGLGFMPVNPNVTSTTAAWAANSATDYVDLTTAAVTSLPGTQNVFALRTAVGISSNAAYTINIGSGGLILNNGATAMTITGAQATSAAAAVSGNIRFTGNAYIWAVGGSTQTIRSNITTGGALSINGVQSSNVILAGNNTINGDIVLNGGTLNIYNSNTDGTNFWSPTAVNPTGGSGTNIVLLGANGNNATNILPRLELRINGSSTITTRKLVIGADDNAVPYVEINADRTNTTGGVATISGGLRVQGGGSEGTVINFTHGNEVDVTFTGPIELNAVSTHFVVNNGTNMTNDIVLNGVVSGNRLVKSGGGPLWLNSAANTYSGGTQMMGGTLRLNGAASTTATYLGTGRLDMYGGTLLIASTTNTAQQNVASSAGNHVAIRGNSSFNVQGVTQLITMGTATTMLQTQNSPFISFNSTGNSAALQWNGGLSINDNANFFINNDQGTSIRGGLVIGSNNANNVFTGNGNLIKTGQGNLTFNRGTAANTFTGDINVFQGGLRAEQVGDTYTSGNITISPGAWIVARANGNATYNKDQITYFKSNSTALSSIVLRGTTDSITDHLNTSVISTGNADGSAVGAIGSGTNGGVLQFEGTYAGAALNMANVYGGYWWLGGGQLSGTYSLSSLGVGASDTKIFGASNAGVYRFGGGDGTLVLNTFNDVLTGANSSVLVGKGWAVNGRGVVEIQRTNNYGGGTVIARGRDRTNGSVLSILQVSVGGGAEAASSTPFGTGKVEVFGRLDFRGSTGSAVGSNISVNDNVYIFHPGSRLRFEFNNGNTLTEAQGGKWGDSEAIVMDGVSLEVNGLSGNTSSNNNEKVGDITFGRASEIRVVRNGTGSAALTANDLLRNATTYGTLRFTHNGSNLGALAVNTSNSENVIINTPLGAPGTGDWSLPYGWMAYELTNDPVMLNPYFVSASDGTWMRYDADKGFQTLFTNGTTMANNYHRLSASGSVGTGASLTGSGITSIVNGTITFGAAVGMLNNGTEILDVTTATATMTTNLDVMALRLNGAGANLYQSANNAANTVQIRSGGLIMGATTNDGNVIRANLIFGTAAQPGVAYVYVNNNTSTIDGQVTATDFVKFGFGSLRIAQDQNTFTGNWVVNQGTLEFDTAYGAGVNGTNTILLNGPSNTNSDALNIPTVAFVTQNGSQNLSGDTTLGTFYHGDITVIDAGQIRFYTPSDRQAKIQNVQLQTTNTTKGQQLGFFQVTLENNRTQATIGNVTLHDDFVFRIESANYGNSTAGGMGTTVGARFNHLNNQGTYHITKIGDGVMYLGDISSTFTGSSSIFTVNEGAVRAEHATGSLGGAGVRFIVDDGGALDIAVANFNPVATLIQNSGSIERWSVNGARTGASYTLGAGVHLQINQSQIGTQTINLNGGAIMGYLAADLDELAVIRTLGSGITLNLQADSYLGQIYPFAGTYAYDMGKQNGYLADQLNPRLNGALLEIEGNITGNFNLTKVGTDVIQINSTGNTYNNTLIKNGVLMMGVDNALPTSKRLTTQANGVLDLNGFTTTVGSIAGLTGTITSGATTVTKLNVGNDNSNFSYTGIVAQSVRIVKQGTGEFTLGVAAQAATITAGSANVTVASTAGWYIGMPVAGPGIPSGTVVMSVNGATSVTLSVAATSNGSSIVASNTNWAGVEVQQGKLTIYNDAALGLAPNTKESGAGNVALTGGTLRAASNVIMHANRGVVVSGAGGALETDATFTTTIQGTSTVDSTFTVTGAGNAALNGVMSGAGQVTKTGTGLLQLNAANTHTGKLEVSVGNVALGANGSLHDTSWVEVKSGAGLNTAAVAGGAKLDGTISGTGTITGNVIVTGKVGDVLNQGVIRPGNASSNTLANAGNQNGTLNIVGNLTLDGADDPTVRAVFQITSATLNDAAGITAAFESDTLEAYLLSQENAWNAATIGNHDSINISGQLSLGYNSLIELVSSGWAPQAGDVIDLMDWGSVAINDFNHGAYNANASRYGGLSGALSLPDLVLAGVHYDLTLFNTSGIIVIVAVPEPSRIVLLALALGALVFRRRRRGLI